jgi:hypothetical protein
MHGALTSKTMYELSQDYAVAARVDRGYRVSSLAVDFNEVKKTVMRAAKEKQYQMLSQIETFSPEKAKNGSVKLVNGHAKFVDEHTIEVTNETTTVNTIGKLFHYSNWSQATYNAGFGGRRAQDYHIGAHIGADQIPGTHAHYRIGHYWMRILNHLQQL